MTPEEKIQYVLTSHRKFRKEVHKRGGKETPIEYNEWKSKIAKDLNLLTTEPTKF